MLAYHNDPRVKAKYTARFASHRAMDEVVQGTGFIEGSGCFVGCTLDSYNHSRFPTELGWPEWLAHLADTIFEGVPRSEAPQFGSDLLEAVPVGADLEPVRSKFLLSVQRRNLVYAESLTKEPTSGAVFVIKTVISLLENDEPAESSAWSEAEDLAWSTSSSPATSVVSAVISAAWSANRKLARSAAIAAESATKSRMPLTRAWS